MNSSRSFSKARVPSASAPIPWEYLAGNCGIFTKSLPPKVGISWGILDQGFLIQTGLDWIWGAISPQTDWRIGPRFWPPIHFRFGRLVSLPSSNPAPSTIPQCQTNTTVPNHPTLLQKLQTLPCFLGWPQQSSCNVPTACDSSPLLWPIGTADFDFRWKTSVLILFQFSKLQRNDDATWRKYIWRMGRNHRSDPSQQNIIFLPAHDWTHTHHTHLFD